MNPQRQTERRGDSGKHEMSVFWKLESESVRATILDPRTLKFYPSVGEAS